MSSPSTPRSTRSASRTADSPAMLTPGQKIKAMMAQFDSDSESDDNTSKTKSKPQITKSSIFNRPSFATQPDQGNDEDEAEDEDDDIIMPRGRMAARLQAENQTDASTEPVSAMERVSKSLKEKERDEDAAGSSDDDLPTAGPRRRLAKAKISEERDDDDDDNNARTPSRARSFSPLFMSPGSERNEDNASDSDRPQPKRNARFEALIAQKRAEREEKEKQERQKKKERAEAAKLAAADDEDEDEDMEMEGDGGSARQARPARKASRKALEDMNRETQRMSRNLQLAHQATTSKKISKESFLARFNFMQPEQQKGPSDNSSTTNGSQNSSDEEAQKNKETPQTSPVMGPSDKPSHGASTEAAQNPQIPSLEKLVEQAQQIPEPVVGRVEDHAANPAPDTVDVKGKKKLATAPSVHVRLSRQAVAKTQMDDSDSDLEVVTSPAKSRRLAVFENVPAKKTQESSALLKLKALAHLTSPTRHTTMNNAELSATLIYQAKKQAAKERQEKIDELRAKGVIIETAAERAAMEDELENLVEKARKEAEDIAKQERSASKKDDGDLDDDDEDEDYEGSEDEADGDGEDQEDEDEDEDEDGEKEHNLFDSEAGEDDESEDGRSEVMSTRGPEVPTQRRKRPTRVIEDDEDEEQAPTTPARPINATPLSVERPQIPGLPSNDMTMSLTQVFAGTLGGSQQDSQPPSSTIPHSLPDPAQRGGEWQESDSQMIVKDSQEPQAQTTDLLARYTPSDTRVSESPAPRAMSQFSQIPDPTQDEGFVLSPFDPSKRFMGTPTSTIETVLVGREQSQSNSPVPDRKMKHLRRGRVELSAIEEQEESGFEIDASAFNVMKKAAKKPNVEFDRKKSKAKDVVEEAAEESEDEYAGLGGASDEEDEEENAYDRQMINDNSGETVDEKELAALNAAHQRTTDEKQVAKLMRDITTGALRRRRGQDDNMDLDDSDDELLARRRQKQREFARMRNALMADGKVGEIADDPKKAAFFRTIEDHDSDDDVLDFLDEEGPGSQEYSSSQDVNAGEQQDTTAEGGNKRKRPLEASAEETYNRPPPSLRRKPASAMSKKPASLAEIRESVSFLTERPEYDSFQEDASMEDEAHGEEQLDSIPAEEEPQEDSIPRVHPRRTKGPVVDRLALLRQASSNSATSASSTRFAFHAGSGAPGSGIGFRPPPMLRKSTTGSSSTGGSSKSDSRRASAVSGGGSMAKKGAVNYYTAARERERERELRTQHRSGGSNITKLLNKHAGNRLGALGGTGQWE
ncbi:hypothetical protein P170DRAFT_414332 [Aspergillus steynii IBT 23096]|uniref:DNA replication checkpoint mediator MRC1 domain-containing protein n=1 Tax=Aspergillus steynii IBT 23096 TaxID=1392250 RepID=A0A2I2FYT4_9EURO|nr:uncharacterized protein P170DRAFT_414332 [Aspergillus steynii IBT 23096]PLB45794.1 hypothetical protein P170DRAFT_414332 [Aspergillus steynii IBT 23096]